FVAKYMGDGVLAYFGYPQAHEDDAERAVRASLAAVEAVRRMPTPELLQVRIGLATGLAVVGDLIGSGAAQEQAVIGETQQPRVRPLSYPRPHQPRDRPLSSSRFFPAIAPSRWRNSAWGAPVFLFLPFFVPARPSNG